MRGTREDNQSLQSRPQPERCAEKDRWLTIREVADRLRVSVDTVQRWVHTGQLRAVDVSGKPRSNHGRAAWRISSESLEGFLEGRASKPAVPLRAKPRHKVPGIVEFIK